MKINELDQLFLNRTFEIAKLAGNQTHPNPGVGAVVVHAGKIIGEGFHEKYGSHHAEVNAVNSVHDKSLLKESTIYVSLEPCSFFGKTPACSDLIIKHKIPKVVIGMIDPNPKVAGNGVKALKNAGIEVIVVDFREKHQQINRFFDYNQRTKLPFVSLKWAESQDAFIGKENRRIQISGSLANKFTHKLRSKFQCIVIGKNTALIDDPSLTTRNFFGKSPIPIILDSNLETVDKKLQLFDLHEKIFVINEKKSGIHENIVFVKHEKSDGLKNLLQKLYSEYDIGNIFVEGGANVHNQFLGQNLVQEIYRLRSKKVRLDSGIKANSIPSEFSLIQNQDFEVDCLEIYSQKS